MSLTKVSFSMINGDAVNVLDYGAVNNGVTDSTAAIQAAIDAASASGKWVYVPAGTYKIIPATVIDDEDPTFITKVGVLIRSNMHIWAEPGATFRIADHVSTDASPQSMGMFGTDTPESKVSWYNLIMDMNGQNNPISPNRPTTYVRFNQSQILVSGKPGGVVAYLDDVHIENCTFINNCGVCDLVMAQTNQLNADIGRRWRVIGNFFGNGGFDTDDHTAVFAWADDVEFSSNIVQNNTLPNVTGGNTCYEIHGNRHKITNNTFQGYYRGIWVSSNLTDSEVTDCIISNNIFETAYYGVDFFRTAAALGKTSNLLISGNTFRFDNYVITPGPAPAIKVAIHIASEYEQGFVLIDGNTGTSTDTTVGTAFFSAVTQSVAAQPKTDIVVSNNKTKGFTFFAGIDTRNNVSGLGNITISNNTYIEPFTTATWTVANGISVTTPQEIKTLTLTNNNFIDERSPSKITHGVYIDNSTIGYLNYTEGAANSLLAAIYAEVGTVVINTKVGVWYATAAPTTGPWSRGNIVWNTAPSAGGTPGWVCTTAGTPGTWKAMANLAP